ncbi:serine/threonine-protein kinase [Streptomyces ipomoeae]|uniref:serine/threonine-protein kinase n=1 Tax=Streptomyces ipomoeae TaxID=103232 RepID=UPI0011462038|nr:serine/threonine-protein kinase [Streptomyces ipomoeae]MDX2931936.1 serine/threonine-protein kinase [Streptomyces ipomoeae]TQE29853.1 serine/threonine protein kinase [Streptomyces ipomoeae]
MQGLLLADRYRLVDIIGSGGMGRVWRAHDVVLHRAVAVKELTAALYVSENEQTVLLRRTRAEARAAARINHSAVVTVHDVLEHDNRPWIVMELVEGVSLADAVRERGRVEPREAARIGMWVLRALRAAHRAGVLHRDVKPGNVLLAEDGRVMLTDFGIAQVEGDTTITRTGEIVGSVDYIAPERVRGQEPGPASDLWSLGATLYTAVEGKSPFRRTTPLTTMQAVVDEEAAEPVAAGPLGPVITALLCKDPAVRPGAEEAEQMLAEAAEGRRPRQAEAYVPTGRQAGGSGPGPDGAARGWDGATDGRGVRGAPGADARGARGEGRGVRGSRGEGVRDVSGAEARGAGAYESGHHASAVSPGVPGAHTVPVEHGMPAGSAGPVVMAHRPATAAPRRRGSVRTVALVVLVAALVGGGAAAALYYVDEVRAGSSSVSTGAERTAGTADATGDSGADGGEQPVTDGVPDGWVRVEDPEGFSLALPKGWKRQVEGAQIDYTPDNGEHFVRVAVDESPDFDSPYHHQVDLEEQVRDRLAGYQRVSLEENIYRDRPGALWDFTWTALAKDTEFPGPRRAIEQTYLARDGVEYTIYMSSPVEDWETAREQFETVLRSWRPPQN